MRGCLRLLGAILLLAGACRPFAAPATAHVVVLATGGTIAGSGAAATTAAYRSGAETVDTLLAAVPQLAALARITAKQVANVGSQDMSGEIWLALAFEVNTLLARDDVDGVVITHGTDTLEETAYFLHLVTRSDKPVVLTASMRPSTALSADGPLNIFNAVAVAADPAAGRRGVLVVINDDIHGARAVTKSHTTDLQTFISPESGLIGTTLYGDSRFFRAPYRRHTAASAFTVSADTALPRVDVLYVNAGFSADLVDAAVAAGARGVITAGVGNGNLNAAGLAALGRAVAQGVPVVRASRVPGGVVGRNVEVDDDALGTVAAGDLNPAKARVLLQLALLQTRDSAAIQQFFDDY
jgi:L-asparaginase